MVPMVSGLYVFSKKGIGSAFLAVGLACLTAGCSSALHRAAKHGRTDKAKILLDRGADINAYGNMFWSGGATPLVLASMFGRPETAKLLMDRGADLNRESKCCSGYAPLELSIYNNHYDIARLLIARGAEPTDGALRAAQARGQPSLVLLLEQARQAIKSGRLLAPAPAAVTPAPPTLPGVDQPAYRLAEKPHDFAVVVGIDEYSNDLPAARFAERDAAAVKSHLVALGVPERNIKLLTGTRATGTSLAAYLEDWLPRNVKEDSRVFFYFSGHGAPDPETGRAFLVPSDGDPSFLEKTGYPLQKLYAGLNGLKARQVIVALDSCFSGMGGRSVLAKDARPLATQVDASLGVSGKLVLFAAASAKGITAALEEQGHGIFTYYFLRGLGGEAKDASGAVTARGLYEYLKPKVQDAAARQNRDQTPVLEGAADGELVHF